MNDAVSGGIRSITAATIASFSSMGPCDDGRIKPDLVANGVNLYSSVSSSDSAYDGTYSGTSMATPPLRDPQLLSINSIKSHSLGCGLAPACSKPFSFIQRMTWAALALIINSDGDW